MKTLLLAACLVSALSAQTSTIPSYFLGSGIGFKPYQTSVKAGSSAFVEGGMVVSAPAGLFAFARVDMLSTYAQMVVEGCKSMVSTPSIVALACGGPGFGADSNNVGLAFAGSGKLFFSPAKLRTQNVWLNVEIGVDKTTVPAPVSPSPGSTTVSPVQPSFRVGIFKAF